MVLKKYIFHKTKDALNYTNTWFFYAEHYKFIQAGNNSVFNDIGLGTYTWCNSIGVKETPAVDAAPYTSMTATRYGIVWPVFDLIDTGGGS